MPEEQVILKNFGYCPICREETIFKATHAWLRDSYLCLRCHSIPRERALMRVLDQFYPEWADCVIHETSPSTRGASSRFKKECSSYIPSQFFSDVPSGAKKDGIVCENLENLTFPDESIDLHISQDVMEHVFHPLQAFKEIARTLKPGGAHIFTVPIVKKCNPTVCRAKHGDGGVITFLQEAVYHGCPINDSGSLVTFDWGYDIVEHIWAATGLPTYIIQIDDLHNGIRAEYIDVFVTKKPHVSIRQLPG